MNKEKISKSTAYKIFGGILFISGLIIMTLLPVVLPREASKPSTLVLTEVVTTHITDMNSLTDTRNIVTIETPLAGLISNEGEDEIAEQVGTGEQMLFLDTAVNYIRSLEKPEYERPLIPDRIVISAIELDAPVISADFDRADVDGITFGQWQAPTEYAAGWHPDSALLGEEGNTVINGHHNLHGEVFKNLLDLEIGDTVDIYAKDQRMSFVVANKLIVPELYADLETRKQNARWLGTSEDVRLTLITCWPENTNTHRLILVARPLEDKRTN
ncbi:MAG TPA: sortase [Anaerolineaceae bacterium]|nr:sortase [Anaerolineaceae bacterium]